MENRLAMGVDSLPMIEEAFQSIEGMEKFCDKVLESKLAPDHFYPKKPDGKRDYESGNTAAVMMVLIQGNQLGLPVMTSLQQIIPVNGLMSIKGDGAKSMIFASGKLQKDSWKEVVEGSIEGGDMKVTITATRIDTGETLSRSFSVDMAKRAGLWVTEEMTRKQDGYKALKSAWWKYPQRMITYRALGFLARDLFPDVLAGFPTTEEAVDYPQDTEIIIEANDTQIKLPDPAHSQHRSKQLTGKASLQIDKRAGEMEPPPQDPKQYPSTIGESYPVNQDDPPEDPPEDPPDPRGSKGTMLNGTPGFVLVYTEDELKEMDTSDLATLIECDGLMTKAREINPGQNTNKKLRTIILAFYAGNVVGMIEKFDPTANPDLSDPSTVANMPNMAASDEDPQQAEYESRTKEEIESPPEAPEEPEYEAVGDQEESQEEDPIAPNKGFDAGASDTQADEGNKFNIEIPELVDGKRGFEQVKTLFEEMSNVAGLDNNAYDTMVKTKFPQFQEYRVKEDFCYKAPVADVNTLLNSL